MAVICPTVTATEPHQYREQIEQVAGFAERLHLDFADGKLAPVKLMNMIQAWWPDEIKQIDFHIMDEHPSDHFETIVSLKPNLVIFHAEAKDDLENLIKEIRSTGIRAGLALLQPTQTKDVEKFLTLIDHVLIFSGDLGHFGGHVDEHLFQKAAEIKAINPALEIGWDGGINADNADALVRAGVDVLNVGGFIHKADDPQAAYATLKNIVENTK